ncbi:SAM-dependent methyltransferase [Biformimicrobium ophioploci]|uniref:Cyclopropane-fatty-acyl-phospholipid synthase family protein n=1 Tax=Biformimicrobium ophioploci TaxID=3036711 RepID=A0ABQ6LYV3_9GAMM|nr:cyclopropane-fatty-acyl-phospholipid synthase family protein [Microbulbifer sp. NKW57]GMG87244.1 cyclopropane-fatty-acyl-phospholipid synthase family protein [Microbulbifer sp. NKW57]
MGVVNDFSMQWVEAGMVPDSLIRGGIRRLLEQRLEEVGAADIELLSERNQAFYKSMYLAPVAPLPEKANEQHYEVPAEFFRQVLGSNRKYSCCFWSENNRSDLDQAERDALEITVSRAGIRDGMKVLDLGCGWGSVSLHIAQSFPGCEVIAVSNSASQREWIENEATKLGLDNLGVITADMNDFEIAQTFDRVISVEMFEHMRNYPELFERISRWLKPDGQFFMHIFCHRAAVYEFSVRDQDDWMGKYFFSGGIMPSGELPLQFQDHLAIDKQWCWDGRHYQRTADAWLEKMDRQRTEIMPILRDVYGSEASRWYQRWRLFFMACAELFGYDNGQQWFVGHYLFRRR